MLASALVLFSAVVLCQCLDDFPNQSFTFQLKKCCPNGTVYRHHLDVCKSSPDGLLSTSFLKISSPEETINIELVSDGLAKCPEGFIGTTSHQEFLIFSNGSVQEEEGMLNEEEYCIDYQYDNGTIKSVFLRFCSPDPCLSKPCIKKCCPFNTKLDSDTLECKSSPEEVDILKAVTDENGRLLRESDDFNETFSLMYGTGLKCEENRIKQTTTSWPVVNENGSYINFEALIDVDRVTDHYCVDYVDSNEMTKGYRALACMELYPPMPENSDQASVIYQYFHVASILFMLATLVVYSLLPELRFVHGVLVMCLVSALTLLHSGTVVASIFGKTMPDAPCIANAVVTHFAFLASCAWLNVVAFDVWRTEGVGKGDRPARRHGKLFFYYSLYGWGLPGAITLIGQILDHVKDLPDYVIRPQFGVWTCWFFLQESFIVYLYGPAAFMNAVNICLFVASSVSIYRTQSLSPTIGQHSQAETTPKQRLRVTFILFVLMGIPWITEIITYYTSENLPSVFISDMFNVLTGFTVFLLFACRPNIFRLLRKRYLVIDKLAMFITQQTAWKPAMAEKSFKSNSSSESRPDRHSPSAV